MAKVEGRAKRQEENASRKPIEQVSVKAGSDAIVRAILKPRAKPAVPKKQKVIIPRAKPMQTGFGGKGDSLLRTGVKSDLLSNGGKSDSLLKTGVKSGLLKKYPLRPPGSAGGLRPKPSVRTDSDPGTVYPVPTQTSDREPNMGFGNWDIAQLGAGQGLLSMLQEQSVQRNLAKNNLQTQRIKRRGLPISTIE